MYLTNRNSPIYRTPAQWYKLVSHGRRGGHTDHAITHTHPSFHLYGHPYSTFLHPHRLYKTTK
jgi:hypothetical protein